MKFIPLQKAVQITLHIRDSTACVHDGQWWLAEGNDISDINKDVLVTFYHPARPRTAFKKKQKDQTWVPMNNVLSKLSALELQQLLEGHITFSQN
ncbi:hypothetical protein AVEN_182682-1 [Araneus ventricosus]|uniref:Uncharacterized protein n=1 Tax=Araneus ventricosus TaxID=182803 RepID=A0A4Y2NV86_ARAVE|nr:hypothetical protein AVEN_182682-1 [Araneus ventricosus]